MLLKAKLTSAELITKAAQVESASEQFKSMASDQQTLKIQHADKNSLVKIPLQNHLTKLHSASAYTYFHSGSKKPAGSAKKGKFCMCMPEVEMPEYTVLLMEETHP